MNMIEKSMKIKELELQRISKVLWVSVHTNEGNEYLG